MKNGRQLESMNDGTNTLSFKYDSSGIRTSKTVNGTQTKYTYIGTTLVSQKTGNEVINFAYSAGGAPYGFTYNGVSYFYLLNLQGDVIGIYDSTGTIVVQYLYDSWGKLISITGSLADTIGVKNPLRYRGYYYDTETSLYYLQSRYYDPETCRFINADSLLIAGDYLQGTNMFAYCLNNPVMYVDPTGYACVCITNRVGPRHICNDPNNTHIIDTSRFERKQINQGSVKDNVGYASDAIGMLGTGLEVAASNSSKLTNVGNGIWKMQTTIPKVALTGKRMGNVSNGVSASLSLVNVIDIWINRDDLSTGQKAAGTVIEFGGLGASVAVSALASKAGTSIAAVSVTNPVVLGAVVTVCVGAVGTFTVYCLVDYINDKVGI